MGEEKIVALNNISFTIDKGEFCCLLGTSGSGKSTLLNLMAGLEKPTKGSIQIKNYYLLLQPLKMSVCLLYLNEYPSTLGTRKQPQC